MSGIQSILKLAAVKVLAARLFSFCRAPFVKISALKTNYTMNNHDEQLTFHQILID